MSKADIRALFLQHGAVPREQVEVTFTPDASVKVEVRGLSAGARGRLLNEAMVESEDGEDKKVDIAKMYPMLAIECAYDVESGERIFSEGDFETVSNLSASVLDPIASVAMRLSGLGDKALKEAEKSVSAQP